MKKSKLFKMLGCLVGISTIASVVPVVTTSCGSSEENALPESVYSIDNDGVLHGWADGYSKDKIANDYPNCNTMLLPKSVKSFAPQCNFLIMPGAHTDAYFSSAIPSNIQNLKFEKGSIFGDENALVDKQLMPPFAFSNIKNFDFSNCTKLNVNNLGNFELLFWKVNLNDFKMPSSFDGLYGLATNISALNRSFYVTRKEKTDFFEYSVEEANGITVGSGNLDMRLLLPNVTDYATAINNPYNNVGVLLFNDFTSFTLREGATSLPSNFFCFSSLNSLDLSKYKNLTTIGQFSFSENLSLESITLDPMQLKNSSGLFGGCPILNTITFVNFTPDKLTNWTFANPFDSAGSYTSSEKKVIFGEGCTLGNDEKNDVLTRLGLDPSWTHN